MNNLSDLIGGANLFDGSNYSFTYDKFCSQNSAIYFNKGYLKVPAGVYFSGDFSITAWIYLKSYQMWSKIFYFGNGKTDDSVIFEMYMKTPQIDLTVYQLSLGTNLFALNSSIIELNQWYHVAAILKGTKGYIYVNGQLVINGTSKIPRNITRTTNCVGKTCSEDNTRNANAIYDELKIYNSALTSDQVINDYNTSLTNGINLF